MNLKNEYLIIIVTGGSEWFWWFVVLIINGCYFVIWCEFWLVELMIVSLWLQLSDFDGLSVCDWNFLFWCKVINFDSLCCRWLLFCDLLWIWWLVEVNFCFLCIDGCNDGITSLVLQIVWIRNFGREIN